MRVKELKEILNKMPDETEVVVRVQLHKGAKNNFSESLPISSANYRIDDYTKILVLNPAKPVRTITWVPRPTDMVNCETCKNYKYLKSCRSRGRSCTSCSSNCPCERCNSTNPSMVCQYAERPGWEGVE